MSLSDFTRPPSRMLPVIVLADISGSMKGPKLASQNEAISEMLDAFRADSVTRGAVHLAVVTFGGAAAELTVPLAPVEDVVWREATAAGGTTPWGLAISVAADLIGELPETAYAPLIVMTSDGFPKDKWEPQLERLVGSRRGGQAQRYAVAIGEDADGQKLARFTGSADLVLRTEEAADIVEYFRRITMRVTQALVKGTYESGLSPLTDDF